MEKRIGQISGKEYFIHPIQEQLVVTPVEMQPNVEYSPLQRVQESWRQRRFMRRVGRDGKR